MGGTDHFMAFRTANHLVVSPLRCTGGFRSVFLNRFVRRMDMGCRGGSRGWGWRWGRCRSRCWCWRGGGCRCRRGWRGRGRRRRRSRRRCWCGCRRRGDRRSRCGRRCRGRCDNGFRRRGGRRSLRWCGCRSSCRRGRRRSGGFRHRGHRWRPGGSDRRLSGGCRRRIRCPGGLRRFCLLRKTSPLRRIF